MAKNLQGDSGKMLFKVKYFKNILPPARLNAGSLKIQRLYRGRD